MKSTYQLSSLVIALLLMCALGDALRAQTPPNADSALPSNQECLTRVNDTPEKLLPCLQADQLFSRLTVFQNIADANPGPDGHGNRDAGTSGYKASVNYVAGLMRKAGYTVTIQTYSFAASEITGEPAFSVSGQSYGLMRDWSWARLSAGGTLSAPAQAARGSASGCFAADFLGFAPGNVAVLQRGDCAYDVQVNNAVLAGAAAVMLYKPIPPDSPLSAYNGANDLGAMLVRLSRPAAIPVIGLSSGLGANLFESCTAGSFPNVHLDIRTQAQSIVDYNLIADSPFGDTNHVVVVDAHLDSIFGAGMLDNASGSTSAIEIALRMANTPTLNQLRYIWFGGEELGLNGSAYYTTHLSPTELQRIRFDIDLDVTATPNFDYMVADPANASNVSRFPPNVVPQSKVGNQFFANFFSASGVPARAASFGNDGTDSNSFSLVGVPDTGILTRQDCCKAAWEVNLWGGVLGNYEGNIPSFDGGCVDFPGRWCDNLSNNDPNVLELATRASAFVVLNMANFQFPQLSH